MKNICTEWRSPWYESPTLLTNLDRDRNHSPSGLGRSVSPHVSVTGWCHDYQIQWGTNGRAPRLHYFLYKCKIMRNIPPGRIHCQKYYSEALTGEPCRRCVNDLQVLRPATTRIEGKVFRGL